MLLVLLTGCGSGKVSVHGRVNYDGQSVNEGTIFLEPADGRGPSNEAPIQQGQYDLSAVVPGSKIVRIIGYRKTGRLKETGSPTGEPLKIEEKEPYIDKSYNEHSTLTRDIEPGKDQQIDFDLKSKP
jgi:hypothetical protein